MGLRAALRAQGAVIAPKQPVPRARCASTQGGMARLCQFLAKNGQRSDSEPLFKG
jgi:hypothetical protein